MGTTEIWALAQIIMIDVMMAGDNAIVVGLAAAAVPSEQRKKVIFWGTASAVIMRIILAALAVKLLAIVGLTLAGGLLLAYVTWKMYKELKGGPAKESSTPSAHASMKRAIWAIAAADLSMSLDNVLAVAGAAKDHIGILVVGLFVSVGLMAFAASWIAKLINKYHWIGWLGLAMVAYVAIVMIYHGSAEVVHAAIN